MDIMSLYDEDYDNWNKFYSGNSVFDIPPRYKDPENVGGDGFGKVIKALDTTTNKKVIIKLNTIFEAIDNNRRHLREIQILKHLKHENVIELVGLYYKLDRVNRFKKFYIVTEFLCSSLESILQDSYLESNKVIPYLYQILRGLKYIHSCKIIHRDLKPSNIVVDEDNQLKIIDFGLSRVKHESMTGYVVTRYYRAPELSAKWTSYTKAVDLWSVGCILAEMLTGNKIFKGNDDINQINLIINATGFPSESFLNRINEDTKKYLLSLPVKPNQKDFSEYFGKKIESPEAVDLLYRLLELDPDKRFNCEQALTHKYLEKYHDSEDEQTGEELDDSIENRHFCLKEYKNYIKNEIDEYNSSNSDFYRLHYEIDIL